MDEEWIVFGHQFFLSVVCLCVMLLGAFLLHMGLMRSSTLKFWFEIVVFKLCECEITIPKFLFRF